MNLNDKKFWNEPNLRPTKAKRQHYVPRLLLSTFVVNDKIRVFDIDSSQEFRTTISNTAVESQFYNENIADFHLTNNLYFKNGVAKSKSHNKNSSKSS